MRSKNPANSPMLRVCKLFLWHRYQYDAEGMPDKFRFETSSSGAHKTKIVDSILVWSSTFSMCLLLNHDRKFRVCVEEAGFSKPQTPNTNGGGGSWKQEADRHLRLT